MKAAYLGGARGYQSAYYRPGSGWTETDRRRRHGRIRPALAASTGARITPLAMARPHRPGLMTKAVILMVVVAIALAMAVVLGGLTLF
jgi:hypothetical protein